MSSTVKYVGLDVHKSTIAVAEAGKRAEVRKHGEIELMRWMPPSPGIV